jgi:hypothetical protein
VHTGSNPVAPANNLNHHESTIMFWVLQKNLFNEQAFQSLQDQLVVQQTPHAVVHLRPFIHEIEPDIEIQGPVFVCGSTGMRRVARRKKWTPGYFDDNLDYRLLMKHYDQRLLNHDAAIVRMRDACMRGPIAFVRPVSDDKQFAGQLMTHAEFAEWQQRLIALDGESTYSTLSGDDLIVMASPKTLYSEYRFYVVDRQVVTGSLYKRGDRVHYDAQVDERVRDFAQACADTWCPNRAFCLDVAETPDGLKVLEINAINSSGFYACDMGKFVHAINGLA